MCEKIALSHLQHAASFRLVAQNPKLSPNKKKKNPDGARSRGFISNEKSALFSPFCRFSCTSAWRKTTCFTQLSLPQGHRQAIWLQSRLLIHWARWFKAQVIPLERKLQYRNSVLLTSFLLLFPYDCATTRRWKAMRNNCLTRRTLFLIERNICYIHLGNQ